jgi:hypothetical protein
MDTPTKAPTQINGNLNKGNAGEHYVCFDAWTKGRPTFLVPQQADHDLMMEGLRKDWLAIQVKSIGTQNIKNKPKLYAWSLLTGSGYRGKTKRRFSQETVIDIFAFVVLDIPEVLYYAARKITTTNKVTVHRDKFQEYTLERALLDCYEDID